MPTRRTLLIAPLLAAAGAAHAHPAPARPAKVGELRLGAAPGTRLDTAAIAARLGSPTRALTGGPAPLAAALNAGHLEAAVLDHAILRRAQSLMAERLTILGPAPDGRTVVVRTILPADLRRALDAALRPA